LRELNEICSHYRRVFWALNASQMHFAVGWGSFQRSPRVLAGLAGISLEFRPSMPQECPPRQIPGYAYELIGLH